MSFILDALKKSETERQRRNAPGFADVPDSTDPAGAPRWLWVLGGLLAINLVVLLGVMLRPDMQATTDGARSGDTIPVDEQRDASFSEMVKEAKKKQPDPVADAPDVATMQSKPVVEGRTAMATGTREKRSASYATFNELRANGTIVLPDLHLDIHVYSEQPEERFVFVNMSKYREQGRLAEGPMVMEITPEGVVLEHLGNGFLLPRQ